MVTKIATDITTLERDMLREKVLLGKKRKAEKASAWKISKK